MRTLGAAGKTRHVAPRQRPLPGVSKGARRQTDVGAAAFERRQRSADVIVAAIAQATEAHDGVRPRLRFVQRGGDGDRIGRHEPRPGDAPAATGGCQCAANEGYMGIGTDGYGVVADHDDAQRVHRGYADAA